MTGPDGSNLNFPYLRPTFVFIVFFNSILSCQIWLCRDSHGIFDLAIFELRPLRFFLLGPSLQLYQDLLTPHASKFPPAAHVLQRIVWERIFACRRSRLPPSHSSLLVCSMHATDAALSPATPRAPHRRTGSARAEARVSTRRQHSARRPWLAATRRGS